METTPYDIFSLYWILQGRKSPLGTNSRRFTQYFCNVHTFTISQYVQRGNKRKRVRLKLRKITGARQDHLPELRRRLENQYIRHPWEVVEQYLPPLFVDALWLDMGSRQRARYEEITEGEVISDYVYALKGKQIRAREVSHALKHFFQMRCCDGLGTLPGQAQTDSVKRQKVIELLTGELSAEKVIIFSRYHQPLDELEFQFNEREQITYTRLDGSITDEAEITRRRRDFWKDDGPRVLLITEKARYGLNLQCARYGIAYNTLYNPKKLEQLHGRNRRPGGGDHVIWYHLLCRDTSEEAQWQLLRQREQDFGSIFGNHEELFAALTPSEQLRILEHGSSANIG